MPISSLETAVGGDGTPSPDTGQVGHRFGEIGVRDTNAAVVGDVAGGFTTNATTNTSGDATNNIWSNIYFSQIIHHICPLHHKGPESIPQEVGPHPPRTRRWKQRCWYIICTGIAVIVAIVIVVSLAASENLRGHSQAASSSGSTQSVNQISSVSSISQSSSTLRDIPSTATENSLITTSQVASALSPPMSSIRRTSTGLAATAASTFSTPSTSLSSPPSTTNLPPGVTGPPKTIYVDETLTICTRNSGLGCLGDACNANTCADPRPCVAGFCCTSGCSAGWSCTGTCELGLACLSQSVGSGGACSATS